GPARAARRRGLADAVRAGLRRTHGIRGVSREAGHRGGDVDVHARAEGMVDRADRGDARPAGPARRLHPGLRDRAVHLYAVLILVYQGGAPPAGGCAPLRASRYPPPARAGVNPALAVCPATGTP